MTGASSIENLSMNGGQNPYDPSTSDPEELAEAEMAQMMGFSNFSSKPKPRSKKRKREAAQLAASAPGAESRSGSNTVPLRKPQCIPMGVGDRAEGSGDRKENASWDEALTKGDPNQPRPIDGPVNKTIQQPSLNEQANHSPFSNEQAPSAGIGGHSQYNWHALRKGVRDKKGDLAYYDPSFVEDPWKDLR